ncbi:MAG: HPr family phosphocarrier protein [Acidobacteria bacterium]|nr:HPr family phosphocarrier protein [Acidobacteriota bacterium]
MVETRVKVVNNLGLHARAAAQLVRLAGGYESTIKIIRPDKGVFADAKSILNLLTLAASIGTELHLQADGPDEAEALAAVENLFTKGFGEF